MGATMRVMSSPGLLTVVSICFTWLAFNSSSSTTSDARRFVSMFIWSERGTFGASYSNRGSGLTGSFTARSSASDMSLDFPFSSSFLSPTQFHSMVMVPQKINEKKMNINEQLENSHWYQWFHNGFWSDKPIVPMHYRLRRPIGFWKVQKVVQSGHWFLTH